MKTVHLNCVNCINEAIQFAETHTVRNKIGIIRLCVLNLSQYIHGQIALSSRFDVDEKACVNNINMMIQSIYN